MCGIIGVTVSPQCQQRNAVPLLLEGLKRLEYRGYDSAGVALIMCSNSSCDVKVYKAKGKVDEVIERFSLREKYSLTCLGHTRWATHGPPSDTNAHPHVDCRGYIAVVHNGIIKNYAMLKQVLSEHGHRFRSETDTEVVAHLLEEFLREGLGMLEAMRKLLEVLEGSFALAVLYSGTPNRVYFARRESPLYAAVGDCISAVSSDIPSLLHISRLVVPIEDDEYGYVEPGHLSLYDRRGEPVDWRRRAKIVTWSIEEASKGGYPHYMLKEIFEQPRALYETLIGLIEDPALEEAAELLVNARRVFVTGAGTSYHATLVFKHYITGMAGIVPIDFIASEHPEYMAAVSHEDVLIAVSQSGETTDTLQAVREAKKRGVKIIAVTNVIGSTLSRLADVTLYTRAGPEIGVAATKTFLTQVLTLQLLAARVACKLGVIDKSDFESIVEKLSSAREAARSAERLNPHIKALAVILSKAQSMFVLGRLLGAHLAREAALKIKEISYVHAEAYPAGESKHGPIALVEEGFPVIFVGTPGVEKKLYSNMEEMKARGAKVIVVGVDSYEDAPADYKVLVGSYDETLAPYAIMPPLQLLAYHMAVMLGYDPDKPRNLAKTVTVE
ncbi:glucosamine/fructose-6-phosphate aminotransferase, isomerizing [Pyrolobus fumarii 1A]|uniref:Glutamine--fructose-6-phosphate aminotransferase [isomerizing] n=1 Tax=Pyrolobus fumarii (strain DSM 11204 / 1A) TaxID=694429 RepID=G0EEM3_PYRF1|nr:glutamine--fructose-6-phosphate transaminase (isomerizing) [Pyrolobus fumarii]AEM38845.1 glucosamine/fructose-6-phosphate aminotransferase, isomerizing [Pyrolobus fumarii 1A]